MNLEITDTQKNILIAGLYARRRELHMVIGEMYVANQPLNGINKKVFDAHCEKVDAVNTLLTILGAEV